MIKHISKKSTVTKIEERRKYMMEFGVTVYFCAALDGRALFSVGLCRLTVVPNHNDNPKELGDSSNLH
jgi:hypothetical protein